MKRAVLVVMDGCGAGEAPDAPLFGDHDHPATIRHVWQQEGPLNVPNLAEMGFLRACGVDSEGIPVGRYARLREMSMGKDSVTGHWEMMGIHTKEPFPTYPQGFPADLVGAFQEAIGSEVLGNKPASGTAILDELGDEHIETGKPILYTSADSVFQVACHEAVVPIERLYEICEIGRKLCAAPNNVQRVIARPFEGSSATGFKRTGRRRDYPLEPPANLIDLIGNVYGIGVVPELFSHRGFRETIRTQSNAEHAAALWKAMESDARFIFANFEDFDMLYGHRNDVKGFGQALVDFDQTLGELRSRLGPEDLLLLTADHGNDPTSPSTDHSREFVPAVVFGTHAQPKSLGDRNGMWGIGATVADHLGIDFSLLPDSLLR